jgi:hypothetical protein
MPKPRLDEKAKKIAAAVKDASGLEVQVNPFSLETRSKANEKVKMVLIKFWIK